MCLGHENVRFKHHSDFRYSTSFVQRKEKKCSARQQPLFVFFVLELVARASALDGGGNRGRWDTAASWFYSIPINDMSEAPPPPPFPPFTKQPSSASPAVLSAGCWVLGEASRRKLHEPLLPQRPPSPLVEWCSPPWPFPSSSLAGVVTTPDSERCLCPLVPRSSFHFRRVIICLLWFLSVILTTD